MSIDRYVVAGNPVAHSKSPWIHTRFAAATGQHLVYEKLLVEPGKFDAAARAFFAGGGKGMNITLPFKQDACAFADELTPRARVAGAVNTLVPRENGVLLGDNTDGAGLLRDLVDNLGWRLAGSRILILGAGGAVRGVLEPLLAAGANDVVIANRNAEKARALATAFASVGPLRALPLDVLPDAFDIVINGTSASLSGQVPNVSANVVSARSCCYDMAYADGDTAFMRWARGCGSGQVSDGIGMLVEQAAEAFALWRGIRPVTAAVIVELRRCAAGASIESK
jgi:shikimate dehydrogenase